MRDDKPVIYKSHGEPWSSEEIQAELRWLGEAVEVRGRGYEGWRRLEERTQLNSDMRAATDEQWAEFFRLCATIRARLDEFRPR